MATKFTKILLYNLMKNYNTMNTHKLTNRGTTSNNPKTPKR